MAIKTLIVIDTGNGFQASVYSTLTDTLIAAGIDVDTAFMGSDAGSDFENFDFATSVDLSEYDVVWIIAYETASPGDFTLLSPEEMHALTTFMDAGGGIFATGDHNALGSRLCGYVPRVRTMRAWFDEGNQNLSPMRETFPLSYDRFDATRADTVIPPGNESDNIAQPIDPLSSPAHQILRKGNNDITALPDHAHEGKTLGQGDGEDGLIASDYTQGFEHEAYSGGAIPDGFVEFPSHDIFEVPQVIAQRTIDGTDIDGLDTKTISLFSVYDGFKAGVGRVITGSTFHHYHNFNLDGFASDNPDFTDIKSVFVNITEWLAKPEPRMHLIVERSTFSEDEVNSNNTFEDAIFVTIDGLAPSHFIDGPINTNTPSQELLEKWAPTITVAGSPNITIKPKAPIFSDDSSFYNRLQRFTFRYDIEFTNPTVTFDFDDSPRNINIQARLQSTSETIDITKNAILQLTKSANPFMLDSVADVTPHWLATDLRSFQVTANTSFLGHGLNGTNQDAAIAYLQNVLADMTYEQFENNLSLSQQESALYAFPKNDDDTNVFNFAIARVRLHPASANAQKVRVFFRIFTSQSTALEYRTMGGEPIRGYLKDTNDAGDPIAVPGITADGSEWLSFPFFGEKKNYDASPDQQTDENNVKDVNAEDEYAFFGVLIDNNRNQVYIREHPTDPEASPKLPLMDHLMSEHQCLVAQIEYDGTPIPSSSLPSNSDKLAQRNLAISEVANPGLNSSRIALHTFEIRASTSAISKSTAPDELLLEWVNPSPADTIVKIFISSWDANEVVALADQLYINHQIKLEDEHTISLPSNGMRYVPIPRSVSNQTGIIMAELPLGITKGQRFDLSVRQISNTSYIEKEPDAVFEDLSDKDVIKLFLKIKNKGKQLNEAEVPRGIFEINENEKLVTRKAIFDEAGEGGFLIKQDSKAVALARKNSFHWRKTVGSFQLGIPVSTKEDMLNHHIRLLSVFRWRLEHLDRNSRWYKTFSYYIDLIAEKLQGLGGNPYTVVITPDGDPTKLGISPPTKENAQTPVDQDGIAETPKDDYFEPGLDDWLGDTKGLPDPETAKPIMLTGKISGVLHDHFGNFEGFTLEAYDGQHYQFFSKENAILEIVENAKEKRIIVTVVTTAQDSKRVRRLLLS